MAKRGECLGKSEVALGDTPCLSVHLPSCARRRAATSKEDVNTRDANTVSGGKKHG